MKVSTKSSRVSPAQVVDLRQARVSTKSRSSRSKAVPARSKNHLAWYVPLDTKKSEKKTSHIPQIKWKSPAKIALNAGWLIAAGEGSQEAEAQKRRESALSEVVYTDLTAIPPCPFTSPVVDGECHDDSQTPIIPIIPIEEVAEELPSDSSALVNTSINPQPSADLPISECDPSQVHELGKSLPNKLHEIAAAAATVAAALQNKDQMDTELLIKFLSNPEMIRKVMNENGFTSKPKEKEAPPPPPPPPKAIVSSPLPSLAPAPVVDILTNGGKKPVSKATMSISKTEPVDRPLLLPCSKVETEIKKVMDENGFTFKPEEEKEAPPPPPPKAIASSPLPSSAPLPVVDKLTNGGKKPVSKAIMSITKPEPVNQPLLPCSKVETEIKKVVNENELTFEPEEEAAPAPAPPKAIVSSPLPSLVPASVADKLTNGGNKPVSKAITSISKLEPENLPLLLPCSKAETEIQKVASKLGEPKHTPNAAKEPTHSPSSFNLLPNQIARIQKVRPPPPSTLSRDEEQIDRLVKKYGGPYITGPEPMVSFNSPPSMIRPLLPSTLRHDGKIDRLVKKYGGPHITGPKPMNPFNSPPSMLNSEAAKKMIQDYGAPDAARVNPLPPRMEEVHRTMEKYLSYNHGWRNPFMTPTPPLLAQIASPGTGTFHPSFTPMTREVDLEYHKSLIEKHGGIHESMEGKAPRICQSGNYLQGVEWSHKKTTIETNPKLQKPCIYFSSPRGCKNGHNCLFQHNAPELWNMAQVNKKMKWN